MTEATSPTQRAAVIDCGTNMFTVLIAEGSGDAWERAQKSRCRPRIRFGGFGAFFFLNFSDVPLGMVEASGMPIERSGTPLQAKGWG